MTWLKENWKKVLIALAGVLTLGLAFVFLRKGPGQHELAAAKAEGAAEVHADTAHALVESAEENKKVAEAAAAVAAVKVAEADAVAVERVEEVKEVETSVQTASGSMIKLAGLVNRGDG